MTFPYRSLAFVLACACSSAEPSPPAAPTKSEPATVTTEPTAPARTSARAAPPAPPSATVDEVVALELHPVILSRSALQLFESDDGTHFVVGNVEAIRLPGVGPIARQRRSLAGLAAPGMPPTVTWRA